MFVLLYIGGIDYKSGPYNVEFFAGNTYAKVDEHLIFDDLLVEQTENFQLTIDSSSLPDGVSLGNPNKTTVTIFDDDCK